MNREMLLLKQYLKKRGYSLTQPRLSLFTTLQNHNACTVEQLISLLAHFDRATVYRTINLYEKLNVVQKIGTGRRYKLELSSVFQHHHHHLVCTDCNKITLLKEDPVLERRINQISSKAGFLTTDHQLEIQGLCSDCFN